MSEQSIQTLIGLLVGWSFIAFLSFLCLLFSPQRSNETKSSHVNWFLTVASIIIATSTIFIQEYRYSKYEQDTLNDILNEAWDLLGGEDGKLKKGTTVIYHGYKRHSDTQIELANRKLSKAKLIDPKNKKVIKLEADIFHVMGKYDEAILKCKEAIKVDPEYSSAYVLMGLCYAQLRKFEMAEVTYNTVFKFSKDRWILNFNMALVKMKQREFKTAIRYFNSALEDKPNNVFILSALGLCYSDNYNNTKAFETLERAIFLDNNFVESHVNLGVVYVRTHDIESAIISFETAIKLDPLCDVAYSNLGNCYYKIKEYPNAIKFSKMAHNLNRSSKNPIRTLIKIYNKSGNVEKVKEYEKKLRDIQ